MKDTQLFRQLRVLARKYDVNFRIEKRRGKGSHVTIYFGNQKAIVPKGELKTGTLHAILKQLNLTQEDIANPKS